MIRNCEIQIFFFPEKTAEAEGVHPTYSLRVPKVTKLVNWRFGPGSAQYPHLLLGPNALETEAQPVGSWITFSGPLYLLTALTVGVLWDSVLTQLIH